jgi:hypothetical protein
MHDLGTPLLYNDMVIPVDKLNSDFQQVIKTTKGHRGLPHVRILRVTSTGWSNRVNYPCYKPSPSLFLRYRETCSPTLSEC